jgi:hypothetical protein
MRPLAGLIVLWLAITQTHAQPVNKATPASKASKTCDPNVVHTGPRGGKYYRTKECRKVYLKKR